MSMEGADFTDKAMIVRTNSYVGLKTEQVYTLNPYFIANDNDGIKNH